MATKDEQNKRQPDAEADKPKGRRSSTGRKTAATQKQTSSQQQSSSGKDAPRGRQNNASKQGSPSKAQPQAPDKGELSQLLQKQIAQAIQPVLADFRQQVADTVQQEIEVEQRPGANHKAAGGELPEPAQAKTQKPSEDAERQEPTKQKTQPDASSKEDKQQASEANVSEKDEQEEGPEESAMQPTRGQGIGGTGKKVQQSVTGRVQSVTSGAVQFAEQQGEQWLSSVLAAGLEGLLTEATHQAVQRRADKALHALLQKAADALPEGTMSEEHLRQTERTLQAILRDTIDTVFAEETRANLQAHGVEASRRLAHRDVGGAVQHVGDAVRALLQELVAALRQQWQRILRLLLRLILTALQDSLAPNEKDSLTDLSADPGAEAEK